MQGIRDPARNEYYHSVERLTSEALRNAGVTELPQHEDDDNEHDKGSE